MEKIFNLSRCVVVQFSHVQSEGNDEVHQLAQKGIWWSLSIYTHTYTHPLFFFSLFLVLFTKKSLSIFDSTPNLVSRFHTLIIIRQSWNHYLGYNPCLFRRQSGCFFFSKRLILAYSCIQAFIHWTNFLNEVKPFRLIALSITDKCWQLSLCWLKSCSFIYRDGMCLEGHI